MVKVGLFMKPREVSHNRIMCIENIMDNKMNMIINKNKTKSLKFQLNSPYA